jgi:hypothetical protein
MTAAALPASSAVPAVDIRTMRHRGQGLPVFYTFRAARARCVETKRGRSAAHRDQRPMGFAVPYQRWICGACGIGGACQTNARLCGTRSPVSTLSEKAFCSQSRAM